MLSFVTSNLIFSYFYYINLQKMDQQKTVLQTNIIDCNNDNTFTPDNLTWSFDIGYLNIERSYLQCLSYNSCKCYFQ